jgi:hypothetical protein
MSNYLNYSGTAKALLHHYQMEVYGEKLSIDVSVPTCFAELVCFAKHPALEGRIGASGL